MLKAFEVNTCIESKVINFHLHSIFSLSYDYSMSLATLVSHHLQL